MGLPKLFSKAGVFSNVTIELKRLTRLNFFDIFSKLSKVGIESEVIQLPKVVASCKQETKPFCNSFATFGFTGIEAGSCNRIIRGHAPGERGGG
jgi:hypothetical protein